MQPVAPARTRYRPGPPTTNGQRRQRAATPTELRREYVAVSGPNYSGKLLHTLPHPIDDVTGTFGDDLYERMQHDPQVSACVDVFKASILETGPVITCPIHDSSDPEYEVAKQITDQAIRMLDDMEESLDDILWDLLDSIALGSKIAEIIMKPGTSMHTGKRIWVLDRLKVKPRESTLFVVDAEMNLHGYAVRTRETGGPVSGLFTVGRGTSTYNLLPTYKFIRSTFRPRNHDPRGVSILRPAYSPWWRKQQIIPEYLKYLAQFAGPSIIGFTPPEAQPIADPANPDVVVTPEEVMRDALVQLRNGTAAAFPNGASTKEIMMQGEGAAFLRGMASCDQQITKAILTQELATEEGRYMARAAAEVHQDVLDTLVAQAKLGVTAMLTRQLFRPWVAYNWGDSFTHLTPIADLGAIETRDQPGMWQAVAQLMNSGYLSEDQLYAIDITLGLPRREGKSMATLKNDIAALTARAQAERVSQPAESAPARPPAEPEDEQEQEDEDA